MGIIATVTLRGKWYTVTVLTTRQLLAEQVRAAVRAQRIDPSGNVAAVHRVAAQVVAEHENRSLTGTVDSIDESDLLVGQLVANIAGFGPLQQYLDDPEVEKFRS